MFCEKFVKTLEKRLDKIYNNINASDTAGQNKVKILNAFKGREEKSDIMRIKKYNRTDLYGVKQCYMVITQITPQVFKTLVNYYHKQCYDSYVLKTHIYIFKTAEKIITIYNSMF